MFLLSDEMMQQCDDYGQYPSWDDESALGGQFDEGIVQSDGEEPSTLVSQPRQVGFVVLQHALLLTFVFIHGSGTHNEAGLRIGIVTDL